MMKYYLVLALLSANTAFAALNPITTDLPLSNKSVEVMLLDNLIEVTEKNLVVQKELRQEIQGYQFQKQRFMKDMNNRELAFDMVKRAGQISKKINDNYLINMFSPEFMSELTFMSQLTSPRS